MKANKSNPNKKILRVILAAAALLILCGVFCGTAAADNPVNEQDLRAAIADSGQSTVTLGADITLTTETLTISRTVTLDLNGKTLARSSADDTPDFSVITIESGGNLMLTDSSSQGAGKITGGSAEYGGGVYVNGGTFTMSGGSITGNTVRFDGGGVYNKGTFTMSGGSITGNIANGIGGGGVYVASFGTFTMNGGCITGNYAWDGGGVYNKGTFTMSGGSITGNGALLGGGGVYVIPYGTFIVSGTPVIMNNTNLLEGVADNVYLEVSEELSPKTSSPILVFTFITLTAPLTGGEIHITTAKSIPSIPGNQFGTTTLSAGSGEEHIKSDTLKDASGNPLSAIIIGTSLMWDDTETGEVPFN